MALDKRKLSKAVKDKYSFANETFFHTAKAHLKDRIEVEIGDSKQPDFKPQVKVQRWDNEVNLSFRLRDDGIEPETVDTVSDKVVWKKGKREAHFYDIQNAEHPDGAYEFEVVLLEKPSSNVVEFTVQDKDVEYLYQPALTEEEIAEGAERPENVVGSYAVYAKTPKTNWTGGKEYKTGKVGHIFRPRIEDAIGMWVWGDLHVENGILSVTIPQDFLDNAVYPVRHAAGLTFGYTSIGSTTLSPSANNVGGSPGNLPSTGTVTKTSIYVKLSDWGSGENVKCSVYDSGGNYITNETDVVAGPQSGSQWVDFNYSSQPTLSTGNYFVVWYVSASVTFAGDTGGSGFANQTTGNSYPTWPSTIGITSTLKRSIYATYTASGGSDPTPLRMLMGMGT